MRANNFFILILFCLLSGIFIHFTASVISDNNTLQIINNIFCYVMFVTIALLNSASLLDVAEISALEQIVLNHLSLIHFFYCRIGYFFIFMLLPILVVINFVIVDINTALILVYVLNGISISLALLFASSLYFIHDKPLPKMALLAFFVNAPTFFFTIRFYSDYLFSMHNHLTIYYLALYVLILVISIPTVCNYVIKAHMAE